MKRFEDLNSRTQKTKQDLEFLVSYIEHKFSLNVRLGLSDNEKRFLLYTEPAN